MSDTPVIQLKNLGPKSAQWLNAIGIHTRADLQALGALAAYQRVCAAGCKPSLNLLYALEGALRDCHWQALPEDVRRGLVIAADSLSQSTEADNSD